MICSHIPRPQRIKESAQPEHEATSLRAGNDAYLVYPSNCSGSILSDHDGLAMDGVPLVQIIGHSGWYGLRMTWVIIPTIVAVEGNDINKLCLERGGRKKKEMRGRKREGGGGEGGEKERDKGEEGGQVEGGERTSGWQKRTERQHQIHKALKVMITASDASSEPYLPHDRCSTLDSRQM